MQYWPKTCWRRKGFKWHTLRCPSPSFREVGQKLKQETGGRSWSGDYEGTRLTGLFHLARSAISHMELGPPVWGWYLLQSEGSSCSNWQLKRCCTDIATSQFDLENSSLEAFSSLVTQSLCLVNICNYRSLDSVRRESPFPQERTQLRIHDSQSRFRNKAHWKP